MGTHVFYAAFEAPGIGTHIFYNTFEVPGIGTHKFYDTFEAPALYLRALQKCLLGDPQPAKEIGPFTIRMYYTGASVFGVDHFPFQPWGVLGHF